MTVRPVRSAFAHAPHHAVDQLARIASTSARDLVPAPECVLRAHRPPPAADRDRAHVVIVGEGVDVMATRGPEDGDERGLRHRDDVAHRAHAAGPQLRARHAPNAPQPFDRKRVEERALVARRYHEQSVGLRDATRHLGEMLRARDPDCDREPDAIEHFGA